MVCICIFSVIFWEYYCCQKLIITAAAKTAVFARALVNLDIQAVKMNDCWILSDMQSVFAGQFTYYLLKVELEIEPFGPHFTIII